MSPSPNWSSPNFPTNATGVPSRRTPTAMLNGEPPARFSNAFVPPNPAPGLEEIRSESASPPTRTGDTLCIGIGIQRCTGLDALGRRKYGRGNNKECDETIVGLGCIFAFVASGMAETADLRNFSIDTFCPNSNAVRVGEEHCRKYW